MKLEEKKGPFSSGSSFRVNAGSGAYVHIGIQVPEAQPISANYKDYIPYINNYVVVNKNSGGDVLAAISDSTTSSGTANISDAIQDVYENKAVYTNILEPDVLIKLGENSSSNYYINRSGILEFDCKTDIGNSITIQFLKAMPPETIVDIIYKEDTI